MSKSENEDRRKVVVTLTGDAAAYCRQLAERTGVGIPETIRRSFAVLDLVLSLGPNETLLIRDNKTKQSDRIRFVWALNNSDKEADNE